MAYTTKKYILFGGDYNPNQWDEATLRQDMIYFREAKINTVVLPVFSWAKLEPSEGQYNFGWLDHILDVLEENGIGYILATPTGAQPAWMSRKYPESSATTAKNTGNVRRPLPLQWRSDIGTERDSKAGMLRMSTALPATAKTARRNSGTG